MSFLRNIGLILAGLSLLSANVNAAPIKIGVDGNFEDNGLTVLEYRADGTVWEWLDLTVTNGISYSSLVTDLNNDGLLNNSDNVLYANAGALADVAGLTDNLRGGWSTVSDVDVVNLFNSFFNLSLVDDQNRTYQNNLTIIEDFILAFGDTFHEGNADNGTPLTDVNPTLPNIGYTEGFTNTALGTSIYNETAYVYDGQWADETDDQNSDLIVTATYTNTTEINTVYGTWIVREVTEVPAPSTIGLLSLALISLGVRRFRKG